MKRPRPRIPTPADDPRCAELGQSIGSVQQRRQAVVDGLPRKKERLRTQPQNVKAEAGALIAAGIPELSEFESQWTQLRTDIALDEKHVSLFDQTEKQLKSSLDDAMRQFSARVCGPGSEIRRYYDGEILGELSAAAAALGRAIEKERAFYDELERNGIAAGYLEPLPLLALGRIKDSDSTIAWYLRSLVRRGVLSADDLNTVAADTQG